MNYSPWIAQLKRTRPVEPLNQNLETDICIIGGGIAGVSTAYFLLTMTDKKVVLIEAGKIAHGATGHNAGQISSYYEKKFTDLVASFGVEKAVHAQKIIEEDARELLERICSEAQLTIPRSEFIGYEACVTREHVDTYLQELFARAQVGLSVRPLLIAKEWFVKESFEEKYLPYIDVISHKNLLALLHTENSMYIGAHAFLSGCMNSALFSEEVIGFLLATYPERFTLKEHTPVATVTLQEAEVIIEAGLNVVSAGQVVLCTNGFESLQIVNTHGDAIDKDFHHNVEGVVGYMAGYKTSPIEQPFAASYANPTQDINQLYYYSTRRPYETSVNPQQNIVCIGGPETYIPDRGTYDAQKEYPLEVSDAIETFAMQTYGVSKKMDYYWHGLMGYTKSGVRIIGREPKNHNLLYNLGCNGVGILTSVYGAHRVAQLINNEVLSPTIFDPQGYNEL